MKLKKLDKSVMVKAPEGHHWMNDGSGRFYLMKHSGKFVKHPSASLEAPFRLVIHDKPGTAKEKMAIGALLRVKKA